MEEKKYSYRTVLFNTELLKMLSISKKPILINDVIYEVVNFYTKYPELIPERKQKKLNIKFETEKYNFFKKELKKRGWNINDFLEREVRKKIKELVGK